MSLSKRYTLGDAESTLRVFCNEISPNLVKEISIKNLINAKSLALVDMLGATALEWYKTSASVNIVNSNTTTSIRTGSYTHSSRNMTDSGHGLTTAHIGRRVVLYSSNRVTMTTIGSIPDVNNFITKESFGQNLNPVSWGLLSHHDGSNIDISSLNVHSIASLVDNINGQIASLADYKFRNAPNIKDWRNSVFYCQIGEALELFKGSLISAWGSITLYYYRLLTPVADDGDYLDIKDQYIDWLYDMCKLNFYEIAQKIMPDAISKNMENVIGSITARQLDREAKIKRDNEGK